MKQIKLRLKFDRYIYFSKINKEMYTILNYQYLTADPKTDAFIDEIRRRGTAIGLKRWVQILVF